VSTTCRHCGKESENQWTCSWCNKAIAEHDPELVSPPGQPAPAEISAATLAKLAPRPIWHRIVLALIVVGVIYLALRFLFLK
jgi:hypothetical protein